nr:uncharacterized protein LOC113401879 [Vanessa tameamea]
MERHDIIAWRARYLEKIQRNRTVEKRPIVYLDEIYIHNTYHTKSCWQSEKEPGLMVSESVGSRWIIAHAGTENGFINGALLMFKSQSKSSDYHDDMNSTNFLKWLREKLIPNLLERSLVVMDNAPYHCTQLNKAPTMSSIKSKLQEWLREKSIYFENTWTKAVLFDLVKQNKGSPTYSVDKLLKAHSREVLKLPPYILLYCELNPIEKIWNLVKRKVADKNVSQDPKKIMSITEEAFKSISAEDWAAQCKHAEHLEEQYLKNYRFIDEEIDRLIISTASDSETESDCVSIHSSVILV